MALFFQTQHNWRHVCIGIFLLVLGCEPPGDGDGSEINFATPITNPFNLSADINDAVPNFVDIDNDGDLDAFIGETGVGVYYFEDTFY